MSATYKSSMLRNSSCFLTNTENPKKSPVLLCTTHELCIICTHPHTLCKNDMNVAAGGPVSMRLLVSQV